MQPYYLRTTDRAAAVAQLVVSKLFVDVDGQLAGVDAGSCFVDIGPLYVGTGQMVDDGDGGQVEQQAQIIDEAGRPYWHANILVPELTQEQIAALSGSLLVDANGVPRAPANPYCKFAGYE